MKQAVITGAAAGIGRALARRFIMANYTVTGIDVDAGRAERTQAELTQMGGRVSFLTTDLADQTTVARLVDQLAAGPPIDLLIHNAGINAVGPFPKVDLAAQQRVLAVNLQAPLQLTAGLLQRDCFTRPASLLFISSLSHFVSYPGAASYAASKDGLAAFGRSLGVALAGRQIDVLTVFPGPTRTEHARRYSPDNSREARRMPPEQLADQIFQAVQVRQRVLVPGWGNKLFALAGRYLPGLTGRLMRKMIYEKFTPPPNPLPTSGEGE